MFLALKKGESTSYVVKAIDKSEYKHDRKAFRYLNNKIYLLKQVNHPNILKFIDKKVPS